MPPAAHAHLHAYDSRSRAWENVEVVPRRPIGVMVLSVVVATVGLLTIVGGLLYLLAYAGLATSSALPYPVAFTNVFGVPFVAGLAVVFGAVFLGAATALWRQERWALWTVAALDFGLVAYLVATAAFTVLLVLAAVLLVYLLAIRPYFY